MAEIRCRICGGVFEFTEDESAAVCGLCGAVQALPNVINIEYIGRYGVLTELQQQGEQEKALELYEKLLAEGSNDPCLHFTELLAAYGAVYCKTEDGYTLSCTDPGSVSVLESELYRKTMELADDTQREIFEADCALLEEARTAVLNQKVTGEETVQPINRGFECLEAGAWEAAANQFNTAITEDPENGIAYFGRMMSELQVYRESELKRVGIKLTEAPSYSLVQEYGDELLLERLRSYREEGVLYQAAEFGKNAQTIDEWRSIKKLLMTIIENDRAKEYISLCDRKIRSIMSREGQLVIGCREAANLGITTENMGTRMVSASYYYDYDMTPEEPAKVKNIHERGRFSPGHIMAVAALVIMVILAVLFFIASNINKDEENDVTYNSRAVTQPHDDNNSDSALNVIKNTESFEEDDETSHSVCVAGSKAFILEKGKVKCLSEISVSEPEETTQNGASFALNVTPYASDWREWDDVAQLYNDPDGAMLFAVMENGTVSYDIFSSSDLNYEDTYRSVSGWIGVERLVWETGGTKPCLFAITKDGRLYASDPLVEEQLDPALSPLLSGDAEILEFVAQGGSVHIILEDGSYISVSYVK